MSPLVIRNSARLAVLIALGACADPDTSAGAGGESADDTCAAGEVRDDALGCVPEACGTTELANLDDADVTVGPDESIQAAADALGSGVIGLTAGTWYEPIELGKSHDGITLIGRCAALVILDGERETNDNAMLTFSGGAGTSVGAANLTVTSANAVGIEIASVGSLGGVVVRDNAAGGIAVSKGGAGNFASVEIVDNTGFGLSIANGDVSAANLTISGTRRANKRGTATGILVDAKSSLSLTDSVLDENDSVGMSAAGPASNLWLYGVRIANTTSSATEWESGGIQLGTGVEFTATDLELIDNAYVGLAAAGGISNIHDVVISGANADSSTTIGIAAFGHADVEVTDATLSGHSLAALVVDAGGHLTVSGCTISDTHTSDVDGGGFGVQALGGGAMALSNCVIERSESVGILAGESGTTLMLDNSRIEYSGPSGRQVQDSGLYLVEGATAELSGVAFSNNAGVGILVSDAGTFAQLTDVQVTDTVASAVRYTGVGIDVYGGALTGTAVTISGAAASDAYVENGTLDLRDSTVENAGRAEQSPAIWVGPAGDLTLSDTSIRDGIEAGIACSGAAARFDLAGVTVSGFTPSAANTSGYAPGILASAGCAGGARDLTISDVVGTALYCSDPTSTMILERATVTDIPADTGATDSDGVLFANGCVATIDTLSVARADRTGLRVYGAGTTVTATDVHIDTLGKPESGTGAGILVDGGGELLGDGFVVVDAYGAGVYVYGAGSTADLSDVDITGTAALFPNYGGIALTIAQGGILRASDATISATSGPGAVVFDDSAVSCTGCTFTGSQFAGVVAVGGLAELSQTEISGTAIDTTLGGGVGVLARPVRDSAVQLVMDGVDIHDNPYVAVWIDGASAVSIRNSTLEGGPGVEYRTGAFMNGNGIYAHDIGPGDGALGLTIVGTTVSSCQDAGVLLDNASASLTESAWSDNGTDVVQQACGAYPAPSDVTGATTEICPADDRPTATFVYDPV